MSKPKVIITIAPTGGMASKRQNPNLPTQPDEIARDVIDCWNARNAIFGVSGIGPAQLPASIQSVLLGAGASRGNIP